MSLYRPKGLSQVATSTDYLVHMSRELGRCDVQTAQLPLALQYPWRDVQAAEINPIALRFLMSPDRWDMAKLMGGGSLKGSIAGKRPRVFLSLHDTPQGNFSVRWAPSNEFMAPGTWLAAPTRDSLGGLPDDELLLVRATQQLQDPANIELPKALSHVEGLQEGLGSDLMCCIAARAREIAEFLSSGFEVTQQSSLELHTVSKSAGGEELVVGWRVVAGDDGPPGRGE